MKVRMSKNPKRWKNVPMMILERMNKVVSQVTKPCHCVFPHSNYSKKMAFLIIKYPSMKSKEKKASGLQIKTLSPYVFLPLNG